MTVRESEVVNEGYKVDNVKGRVALDVEWNAKDGNLDRDVGAYRALYDAGLIDGAVVLARTRDDLRELAQRPGPRRRPQRRAGAQPVVDVHHDPPGQARVEDVAGGRRRVPAAGRRHQPAVLARARTTRPTPARRPASRRSCSSTGPRRETPSRRTIGGCRTPALASPTPRRPPAGAPPTPRSTPMTATEPAQRGAERSRAVSTPRRAAPLRVDAAPPGPGDLSRFRGWVVLRLRRSAVAFHQPHRQGGTRAPAPDRYDTMTLDGDRCATGRRVAATNAHLYLWVPNALLPEGLEVMEAWGFRYMSNSSGRRSARTAAPTAVASASTSATSPS